MPDRVAEHHADGHEKRGVDHPRPLTVPERERARDRIRKRFLAMSAGSYAFDAALLGAFALAGTVSYAVPAAYLAAAWGSCGLIYAWFTSAPSRRFPDAYLAPQQLFFATLIQLAGIAFVPKLAFLFLVFLFNVFGMSSLRLRTRTAAVAWTLVVSAVGIALSRSLDTPWFAQATPVERALVWLGYSVTLGRSIVLGTFAREIRDQLTRRNFELQDALSAVRQRDRELEHHRATLEAQVAERTEEMRIAKEAAEYASRVKSQFLAVMSHELRTPMNAVLGMAELLQRTSLSEQQRTLLGHVNTAGRSLLGIIEDVLDLSRIEEGRTRIVLAPFDLGSELREVVGLFAQTAHERHLSLELALDPRLPQYVSGDVGRLRQILINLIGNALKFTDRGGVSVQVAPAAGRIRVSVIDSGPGIDPGFLPNIYEAFSQQDASATRRFGGTGLGLAIVKRLVDLMEGEITIDSRLGEGSTFTVELPLPAVAGLPASAASVLERRAPVPLAPGMAARILIVEDNATNREYMRLLLESHGYALEAAADGLEALEILAERSFAVVLMDRQMPGLDGLQTTLRIRGMEQAAGLTRTPIVAVSAHVMDKSRRDFLEAGADDFLAKPFLPDELLAVIARWLPATPAPQTGVVSRD